ncbi:MAG: tetratricopeptide repeat protein, partial [Proteobacteria bacterium]|nr:tetratricopeptide repeat protein [Pseudomonadota bacterium]
MLGAQQRETEAANLLSAGIVEVPESADLYHALGLSRIRQQQTKNALDALTRAAKLAPGNRRYQYVYAVALQSTGKVNEAIEVLQSILKNNPGDPEILSALVAFNRDAGKKSVALEYARKLQSMLPNNPEIKKLVESLQP